jgi:hypothetical protein
MAMILLVRELTVMTNACHDGKKGRREKNKDQKTLGE